MPLEGIDHIHGGDSLPLGVFGVGDGIPDDVLKENLEDSTGLLIDETRDTLDSTTASQTPDGGLGDSLDVVSQHLTVTLGASLSESLSSFATSSHVAVVSVTDDWTLNQYCLYRVLLPMRAGAWPLAGMVTQSRVAEIFQNNRLEGKIRTKENIFYFVTSDFSNNFSFHSLIFSHSEESLR